MAKLFTDSHDDDGDGATIYDLLPDGTPNPDMDDLYFELGMEPYDFGNATTFAARVDLSVPGYIMDCAKCHAGGGGAEYVSAKNLDDRVSLRDFYTADAFDHLTTADGVTPQPAKTYTNANYTAFNYFIDIFDVDGNGDKNEVKEMDWRETGVLEVDCLMCHLSNYDFNGRHHMVESARVDASRVVGAGLGDYNRDVTWAAGSTATPADYGTQVFYNSSNGMLASAGPGEPLKLSSSMLTRINYRPETKNCNFCHFNTDLDGDGDIDTDPAGTMADSFGASDWKKRGDVWMGDATHDVHTVLGCLGCHEQKDGSFVGIDGNPMSPANGLCDPAKGDVPYSTLWDANDNTMKTCADCHLRAALERNPVDVVDNATGLPNADENDPNFPGDGNQDLDEFGSLVWEFLDSRDYGAPDPSAAHQRAGLSSMICQTEGDGVKNATHLDVIHCTTCHVRKIADAEWNTAAAIIDASGHDAHGHLKDFKNNYVNRKMYDPATEKTNLTYAWWRDKIYPANLSTTLYWADMNPGIDINGDGHTGMTAAGAQGLDAVLPTDVLAINESMGWHSLTSDELGDVSPTDIQDRINAITAYFDVRNGVDPMNPDPMVHPWIRLGIVVVPFRIDHNIGPAAKALGSNGCIDCHNPNPGEGMFSSMYRLQGDNMINLEANIPDMNPASPFYGYPTQIMPFGMNPANMSNGSGLPPMNDFPWFVIDRDGEEIWASVFSLPTGPTPTMQLRDMQTSELLYNPNVTYTPIDGAPVADRNAWVSYLDNINPAVYAVAPTSSFEIDIDQGGSTAPVAVSVDVPVAVAIPVTTIEKETTVDLLADASAAEGSLYFWSVNDKPADPALPLIGETLTYAFDIPGTWRVMLTVIGPEGDLVQSVTRVEVARNLAATTALVSGTASGSASATIDLSNIPAHDQLYYFFGDGTRLSVVDGDGTTAGGTNQVVRDYRRRSTFLKYFDPDSGINFASEAAYTAYYALPENDDTGHDANQVYQYVYKASVQVKNDGAMVEVINFDVIILQ